MVASTCHVGMDIVERRQQTASRRKNSIGKDKAEFNRRSLVSSRTGKKACAEPVGSDFAHPHRDARVAVRTCLANGSIDEGSDMPQISMGHAGTWKRWLRKPAVSASLNHPETYQQVSSQKALRQVLPAEGTDEEVLELQMKILDEGRAILENVRIQAAEKAVLGRVGKLVIEEDDMGGESIGFVAEDAQDDESVGSHEEFVSGCPQPFEANLNDPVTFPALASMLAKSAPQVLCEVDLPASVEPELEPAQDGQPADLTPEKSLQCVVEHESPNAEADWIVVEFDAQHPRNSFARKAVSKQSKANGASQEAGLGVDWSQSGIPVEVKRQFIRGNANAAHHGLYAKNQALAVPIEIMRAQQMGSSKRENSTPKTPRSQSKPRAIRQSSGRR